MRNAIVIGVVFVIGLVSASPSAFAQEDFEAELVSQNVKNFKTPVGGAYTMEVKFKNIGSVDWVNFGPHFIALNTSAPADRTSEFQHRWWKAPNRPAMMLEKRVKPGEVATFRFAMQAPNRELEGVEEFHLVAEHLTWITGGAVKINVRVGNPKPHFLGEVVDPPAEVTMPQGSTRGFDVHFKNLGAVEWYKDAKQGAHFLAMNTTDPASRESDFFEESWYESYRPSYMEEEVVKPGETARFDFRLKAPTVPGVYEESFQLVAENLTWIPGTELSIRIIVPVENIEISKDQPADLRIGVYNLDLETGETSAAFSISEDADVYTADGARLLTVANDRQFTLTYADGVYTIAADGGAQRTSSTYFRIVPENTLNAITTILSKDSTYNEYRGVIEFRYADEPEELWVINELPLELYLRGLGETSNSSHTEFQKALITAARTYAMFLYESNTKHASQNFHMTNTSGDQVYLGYVFETLTPNITAAVAATEGYIITYDGDIALTPYFSQSDGRTYSYEEVWGATSRYGYLVSVDDPCCEGELLLGHGVGLSAVGALWFATEQAQTWDWILGYYYSTTLLQKVY